jgi:hypothetical protein
MKKLKVSTEMKKADTVFSQFTRLKEADQNGMVMCCTCGKFLSWRDAHAGHYIVRQFKNTRYEERNVHAQCCYCNTFLDGNCAEYTKFLENKYGIDIISDLLTMKNDTSRSWKAQDYHDIFITYTIKVEVIKRLKGII